MQKVSMVLHKAISMWSPPIITTNFVPYDVLEGPPYLIGEVIQWLVHYQHRDLVWVKVLSCIILYRIISGVATLVWKSGRRASIPFSVVQQHLEEQHGMKTTSLECLFLY